LNNDIFNNESFLTTRLKAGDIGAFDSLYARYYQRVFNNVFSILKDRQFAEDIVQEVFISLWEKRDSLKNPNNVGGWLFATSSNKSLNHLRKHLRAKLNLRFVESISDIPYIADDGDLFEEHMAILKIAITALTPQQRRVFELCKVEGKSYEETAETLNLSKNTVKTHMRLAINSIRDHVMDQPGMAALTSACLLILSSQFLFK
jgi:RNA polymerase sigma-70 factor (family 1)